MKKILAIHDISTLGKASLGVVLPVLCAYGLDCCPLPTAALSAITRGYGTPEIADLTELMRGAAKHFDRIKAQFDWVYSGFLGSPDQIEIILDLIEIVKQKNVLIDPVMGDNGKLFPTISPAMVAGMKKLVQKATIITPNWTEARFLTDEKFTKPLDVARAIETDGNVIITSVPNGNANEMAGVDVLVLEDDVPTIIRGDYVPTECSGAGDAFSSIIIGEIERGASIASAAQTAMAKIKTMVNQDEVSPAKLFMAAN